MRVQLQGLAVQHDHLLQVRSPIPRDMTHPPLRRVEQVLHGLVAEWRVYVLRGTVVSAACYRGDEGNAPAVYPATSTPP